MEVIVKIEKTNAWGKTKTDKDKMMFVDCLLLQ